MTDDPKYLSASLRLLKRLKSQHRNIHKPSFPCIIFWGDTETDLADPAAERLKRESSDNGEEGASAEEMSSYYSSPTSFDTSQKKTFTFTVRNSLVTTCPPRDFAYALQSNADPDASSPSKQSNYELVHGMDGSMLWAWERGKFMCATSVNSTGADYKDAESVGLIISQPPNFIPATDTITACTLYQDKGPRCWLQRTCSEMTSDRMQWPSTSDQGNAYRVLCRKSGGLEIYDLPIVTRVFAVDDYFNHGMSVLWDQKVLGRRAYVNAASKGGADEDTTPGDAILRDEMLV